ncbi:MAG: leucyl/phenylalanyl-tRNA--protein transferase [Flavobacteriales bacterium]|nr:leucyl/phenylalanyl-tRNA--protein transferase [Flavobacteriales bacterium]
MTTLVDRIPAEELLAAYRHGRFPMAHDDGELHWHDPDPRAIFDLNTLWPDERTDRLMRSGRFVIHTDADFDEVVRRCADRDETWIDARIKASYQELHRLGHAHSAEVCEQGTLVGGIYGVAIGGAFFGESMFGVNNAGKLAFYALAARLQRQGFMLFDTQYINPFTQQLGAFEVPKAQFLKILAAAIDLPVRF